MQKTNTALLVVVLALVLGLWFRPQPDRYRNLVGEDYYLLDTATGTVVLPKVSEGVEDHIRKKEEKRKAEADAAPERRARLTESLNLTGTPKRPYPNILPSQLGQVEECTKRAKVEKEERSPKQSNLGNPNQKTFGRGVDFS